MRKIAKLTTPSWILLFYYFTISLIISKIVNVLKIKLDLITNQNSKILHVLTVPNGSWLTFPFTQTSPDLYSPSAILISCIKDIYFWLLKKNDIVKCLVTENEQNINSKSVEIEAEILNGSRVIFIAINFLIQCTLDYVENFCSQFVKYEAIYKEILI